MHYPTWSTYGFSEPGTELLLKNISTCLPFTVINFLLRSGSVCHKAGIIKGSILAIDRTLTPEYGQVIVAENDGKLVLRRLLPESVPTLQALNDDETVSLLDQGAGLPIWGEAYALSDVAGASFNKVPGE